MTIRRGRGCRQAVGIFDSGVGGLVVLAELRRLRPTTDFYYWAETALLPLGNLPPAVIRQATLGGVARLMSQSTGTAFVPKSNPTSPPLAPSTVTFSDVLAADVIDVIVLACHTASACAADGVRGRWPAVPVVGMLETTVDVAAAATRSGRVALVGTTATVCSGAHVRLAVERGLSMTTAGSATLGVMLHNGSSRSQLRHEVERLVTPLLVDGVDTLVLACTAYTDIADLFADVAGPQVRVVSPDRQLAQHVASLLHPDPPDEAQLPGRTSIWHTGAEAGLTATARRLLQDAGRGLPDLVVSPTPG